MNNKLAESKIYARFKASNGYLENFFKKFRVSLRAVTSEPFKLKPGNTFKDIKKEIEDMFDEADEKMFRIKKKIKR